MNMKISKISLAVIALLAVCALIWKPLSPPAIPNCVEVSPFISPVTFYDSLAVCNSQGQNWCRSLWSVDDTTDIAAAKSHAVMGVDGEYLESDLQDDVEVFIPTFNPSSDCAWSDALLIITHLQSKVIPGKVPNKFEFRAFIPAVDPYQTSGVFRCDTTVKVDTFYLLGWPDSVFLHSFNTATTLDDTAFTWLDQLRFEVQLE